MDSFSFESSGSTTASRKNKQLKQKKNRMAVGGYKVKLSTDPQSVAARERRHRISDRFKILQSMVPGGSKMDIVSMLEEAIRYVKFLKTHIIWLHQQQAALFSVQNHDDSTPIANYNLIFPPKYNITNYPYSYCPLPSPHNPNHQQAAEDLFGYLSFSAPRRSQVVQLDDEVLETQLGC